MAVTDLQPRRTNLPHYAERVDLAAAFRWTARLDMHEGVANHFSLSVSEDGRQFLMNPNQVHFSLLRATDLLLIDANDPETMNRPDAPDPTAWGLHGALHLGAQDGGLNSPPALVSHHSGKPHRGPDLGDFQNLQVPAGNKFAFRAYAVGVQIYRWNGTNWTFDRPGANLYADANYRGKVGTHYGGPTWESNSGSRVMGGILGRCTPDTSAIQWLLLQAAPTEDPGIFSGATYIQRVNTVGGLAPVTPGTMVGEEKGIPYTAEYYFYRAEE